MIHRSRLLVLLVPLIATAASAFTPQGNDSLPVLNRRILAFVDARLGQRVGTGECWDVAAQALDDNGAVWDHKLRFGRVVDPRRETVLPGDIMQFEGVEVQYTVGTSRVRERYGHHTAIVYEVHGPGRYTLAHQNIGRAGRKVGLTELDTAHRTKGRITIFRPQDR